MQFKITEDLTPDIFNDDNSYEVVEVDGEFYYNDGSNHLKIIRGDAKTALMYELERQQKEQKSIEDGTAPASKDERIQKNKDRIEKGQLDFNPKDLVKKVEKAAEDRDKKFHGDDTAQPKKKKSNFSKMKTNPALEAIESDIIDYINNLIADQYEIEKVEYKKKGYQPHDPYGDEIGKQVGRAMGTNNGILNPKKNKRKKKQKKLVEREKPYVLFYFDRSKSFEESYHPKKTQLGLDLIQMFRKYELGVPKDGVKDPDPNNPKDWEIRPNSIIVEKFSFGSDVFPYEEQPEFAGCNGDETSANKVINHIRQRSEGHLVNIVMVTDAHMAAATASVAVEGGVWLCFTTPYTDDFTSELLNSLQEKIHSQGEGSHNVQYQFTNLD